MICACDVYLEVVMSEQKYVLTYVEPLLEDGYQTWPLPTDRRTVVGVSELAGKPSERLLVATIR